MTEPIVAQHQRVAFRMLDGAAVLVNPTDSSLYMLNPVASRIWALADGSRTVRGISEQLVQEFDVELETASTDVAEMIDHFLANELLVASTEETL